MKSFVIGLTVIIFSTPGWGCQLTTDSDWFQPISTVANKTDQIFIGQQVGVRDVCAEAKKSDVPDDRIDERTKKFEQLEQGCFDYSFKVLKTLKGSIKEGDIVSVRGQLKNRADGRVFFGADCQLKLGFNKSEKYLIMRDAFHPKAYEKVNSIKSPWVKVVTTVISASPNP